MRVTVIGATGLVGRALVPALRRNGHTVAAWVRSEARARALLGAEAECVPDSGGADALTNLMGRSDAVVNLAGEPLLARRWTAARRERLRASRVALTERLVQAMAGAQSRPRVLVSSSAVGYYGDRADEPLPESAAPGDDFLARLCQDWERAAQAASIHGIRVVTLRGGVALGRDGGALAPMLPPFRLGVGGPVGSGRQYLPWIHLHDLVGVITTALVDDRYHGPVNAVAPEAVTSAGFARALGRALKRPAILPTPVLLLRALFGEAATVLLSSQRVEPRGLRQLGFVFSFPTLDAALADVVGEDEVRIARVSASGCKTGDAEGQAYLDRVRPAYALRTRTVVHEPLETVFAFFSRAENLGLITPAAMRFAIDGPVPVIAQGTRVRYTLRVGPVPIRWQTVIADWRQGRRFVDLQESGPYRVWWHEHRFAAEAGRTIMDDCVYYAPPLGPLGRLAHALFIAPRLRKVFQYRRDVIRLRFGAS